MDGFLLLLLRALPFSIFTIFAIYNICNKVLINNQQSGRRWEKVEWTASYFSSFAFHAHSDSLLCHDSYQLIFFSQYRCEETSIQILFQNQKTCFPIKRSEGTTLYGDKHSALFLSYRGRSGAKDNVIITLLL